MDNLFDVIRTILLVVLMVRALYDDIQNRKIRNILTLPAFISGIIIEIVQNSLAGSVMIVKELLVMFAIVFVLYVLQFFGAGDAKLLLAITAIMGLTFAVGVTIYAIMIGAIISIFILKDIHVLKSLNLLINNIRNTFLSKEIVRNEVSENKKVLFAIPISIACCLQWLLPLYDVLAI